jgi:dihydroorotase-like cyclic amidohydrolase
MSQEMICLPQIIVDTHCHGRDWMQAHKTTLRQTLCEARGGGISVSFFMPNTDKPIVSMGNLGIYDTLMRSAEKNLSLPERQYVYFGVTDDNLIQCKAALEEDLVVGLKVYPKSNSGKMVTTGSIGVAEDLTIVYALNLSQQTGKTVAFHCDDPEIVASEGHTIRAEVAYVEKVLELARNFPYARIVICHVSCRQSAKLVIAAQKAGMRVALELCPHYLWFDADRTNWRTGLDSVFYHCFNNLRSAAHREFLVSLLKDGGPFIIIGSDNAPHTREEKLKHGWGGLPSNQEMVPVILTLAKQHGISDRRVIDLLSLNAIHFFGLRVPMGVRMYRYEKRKVASVYNNGVIENPWLGSELYHHHPVFA